MKNGVLSQHLACHCGLLTPCHVYVTSYKIQLSRDRSIMPSDSRGPLMEIHEGCDSRMVTGSLRQLEMSYHIRCPFIVTGTRIAVACQHDVIQSAIAGTS